AVNENGLSSPRPLACDLPELPRRGAVGHDPEQGATMDFPQLDAYWRAANYLTVGQIYLQDNPLLRERLRPEHIKPRLLGHWGTSPGLNLLLAHLNQFILRDDLNVLFMAGPGHGGPAVVANAY